MHKVTDHFMDALTLKISTNEEEVSPMRLMASSWLDEAPAPQRRG
jgi:hypothetical protein